MKQHQLVAMLEIALKENIELYDSLGNGDFTYKEAGKVYDSRVGFPTINAISKTIEYLKEEN
jgi:hypothetical protein